jgi:hypothetical protein
LRARGQFVATVSIASVVTLLVLLTGAYLALRSQALAEEQTRLTREAVIASALVSSSVQTLADSSQGATTLSDRISAMTGDDAAIYQANGQSLVAVSAHGVDVVGAPLPPDAKPAVVGSCGPIAPTTCHHAYTGVVRAGGVEYAATYAPIFDATGKFAGALMVGVPMTQALAGANQAMLALMLVGMLLALLVIGASAYTFNRSTGQTLDALQTHLRAVASYTMAMEQAAHATVLASRRQERLARQIGDGARGLDALVSSVNQGYPALQQSAGAMWAEVSHPGATADPLVVMRLARETTLMATRVGAGMEDARVYSDHITRLMNHVVAQGRVAAQSGQETQRAAHELRAAIGDVEEILGGRMLKRSEAVSPLSMPSRPSLPVPIGESRAHPPGQSTWGPSSVWQAGGAFPSIPPLPPTERLPIVEAESKVVTGEVRAIKMEPSARADPAAPARYGDISFPKLMKDATTRPLAAEPESASTQAD